LRVRDGKGDRRRDKRYMSGRGGGRAGLLHLVPLLDLRALGHQGEQPAPPRPTGDWVSSPPHRRAAAFGMPIHAVASAVGMLIGIVPPACRFRGPHVFCDGVLVGRMKRCDKVKR
jgi:hypothetical protein